MSALSVIHPILAPCRTPFLHSLSLTIRSYFVGLLFCCSHIKAALAASARARQIGQFTGTHTGTHIHTRTHTFATGRVCIIITATTAGTTHRQWLARIAGAFAPRASSFTLNCFSTYVCVSVCVCGCADLPACLCVCVPNLIANQFVLILAAFLAHPLNNTASRARRPNWGAEKKRRTFCKFSI